MIRGNLHLKLQFAHCTLKSFHNNNNNFHFAYRIDWPNDRPIINRNFRELRRLHYKPIHIISKHCQLAPGVIYLFRC